MYGVAGSGRRPPARAEYSQLQLPGMVFPTYIVKFSSQIDLCLSRKQYVQTLKSAPFYVNFGRSSKDF